MGMDSSMSHQMIQPDRSSVFNKLCRQIVPRIWTLHLTVRTERLSLVLYNKQIVLIFVRIECNLLLLASTGIHVTVRMKIAPLCVVVADGNSGAKHDVSRDILHTLGVQGGLEFRGHETVTISGIDKADEVNRKHSNIEADRNDNKTEHSGKEVLEP